MFNGYKIVAVTPAGRKRYMEVLLPYILRDRYLIDEYQLWLNTTVPEDLEYCRQLEADYPDFIRCIDANPEVGVHEIRGYSIHQFFVNCVDPNSVYVRFDDDICWVDEGAVFELVNFRIKRPDYFLVFANIVNNALCSHIHLRLNALGALDGKLVGYDCTCPIGWGDPAWAEHAHRAFLDKLHHGRANDFKFPRWELFGGERFSIGCFAFLGSEFAQFEGKVFYDEEWWLSHAKPMELGRANCILGTSLVSHFAFSTQREHLETTNLLSQYRKISEGLRKEPVEVVPVEPVEPVEVVPAEVEPVEPVVPAEPIDPLGTFTVIVSE